jgi:hypothetical protein
MSHCRGCASPSRLHPFYLAARLIHDEDGPHRELHHVIYGSFLECLRRTLGVPE